jgi:hypothetical protein
MNDFAWPTRCEVARNSIVMGGWLLAIVPALAADPKPVLTPEVIEAFEKEVRPILAEHCFQCHGQKKQMAGLRLDTSEGVRKGSDEGPIFGLGDPENSRFVAAIRRTGDYPMPPNKPLPESAVRVLVEWARRGAPFPPAVAPRSADSRNPATSHWAFQPVSDPPVPALPDSVATDSRPFTEVDRFILAKQAPLGLTMAPPADRRVLIRRLYFDLIGLPPSAEDVEAFIRDPSPQAYSKLVEALLASPHYGERWGRHWLDVARYADTKGYVFQEDRNYPYAWAYRDYVIRSFNDDKPYNRFVMEQLAADQLDLANDPQSLAAMGFLTVGRRFLNNIHDIIDDRIDVVTRGLMGLTVSCARCHDHKYDPIPIADYYSLYGVFASSIEPKELPVIQKPDTSPAAQAYQAELAGKQQALAEARTARIREMENLLRGLTGGAALLRGEFPLGFNRADRDRFNRMQTEIDRFIASSPYAPVRAMILADLPKPIQPQVFLRGNPESRGPRTPRQFLKLLAGEKRVPFPENRSGRRELAEAIVDPNNPLTSRVIVNRVWAWHFGQGLVSTPSDFGTRADPPSHPELLDWLARRFVTDDGWSLKQLHRRILLSATYQQSSLASLETIQRDPDNRWYTRQNRRRLEFEPLRDAMLAVANRLDRSIGGRPVNLFQPPYPTRRSVYGFIDRQNLPGVFRVFDFASPDTHSPQRYLTTVPQQALFLLNHPFVREQALAVAQLPSVTSSDTLAEGIEQLYRQLVSRPPTTEERELALAFLQEWTASAKPVEAWAMLAQVLLLSNEFAFVD